MTINNPARRLLPLALTLALALLGPALYAQYDGYGDSEGGGYSDGYYEYGDEDAPAKASAQDGESGGAFFFSFNYGASASWLTRIIDQTKNERSNFVFQDFMPGLYFSADMHNVKLLTPTARLAVFYPLRSTFNGMEQKPKTPLHVGADLMAGAKIEIADLNWLRINIGPALHLLYLTSDRWNYFNIGAAAFASIEVPLASQWTVLINGYASMDNGNLGGNREMEPFDIAYQYQVDIGVRYSKKKRNVATVFSIRGGEKPAPSQAAPPDAFDSYMDGSDSYIGDSNNDDGSSEAPADEESGAFRR